MRYPQVLLRVMSKFTSMTAQQRRAARPSLLIPLKLLNVRPSLDPRPALDGPAADWILLPNLATRRVKSLFVQAPKITKVEKQGMVKANEETKRLLSRPTAANRQP